MALAEHAYVSHSLVATWETGRRSPKAEDPARIEEILGSNGYLSRLLTELVSREVAYEWPGRWIEVESRAITLLSFETTVLPGPLRTPDCARAVLKNEDLVQVRLERQRVLAGGEPPMLVALRRLPRPVRHRQLRRRQGRRVRGQPAPRYRGQAAGG
ncbi:hypothetical protein FB471_4563 [Amycolatopsis cihanbeyliensis]|uniref:DUF5753 domain-containing protein n=1 Tax=Amycolatopsis cihanbeyliensis TaxID=1128664 RepID=A0A542DP55_AMYCI|nr:hypothetical protein FB471_4563 [Amycolatopsis cihanbeyliensis]